MTPSHKLTAEKLAEEINQWANENVIGSATKISFTEMVAQIEEMASRMAKQELKLVNPRMVHTTLVADGFYFVKPVEHVNITFSINKVGDSYP